MRVPTALDSSSHPTSVYNADYFLYHHEGATRSAEAVVPILIELFNPRSVVDVGCGTGVWLSVFLKHGIADVLGIDGPWMTADQLKIPEGQFARRDLRKKIDFNRRFDLAISVEVAEHLPEDAAPQFVRNITRLAHFVVFSGAPPSQGGRDHVNEQWPSYWYSLFAAEGFECFDILRPRIWSNEKIEWYYRQNIFCFAAACCTNLLPQKSNIVGKPLHLVHPELFASAIEERDRAQAELARIRNSRAWRMYHLVTKPVRWLRKNGSRS